MAMSTTSNEVHVYGRQQVEVVFSISYGSVIEYLKFIKGVYLVGVDHKGNVLVFSLLQKKMIYSVLCPGKPTAIESDPSLDWLLLGMTNGTILAFDIDRGVMAPFCIENLQREILPKERLSGIISIEWNPRDIGTILISYSQCAVIYSLATGEIKTSFKYEIPPKAPGGDGILSSEVRCPRLIKALYHPNSLNAITVHEDGSIVFWDALTGKLILARNLYDIDVNFTSSNNLASEGLKTKINEIKWITYQNHDDTALLILTNDGAKLTLMDFGVAPKYSLTSYEKMNKYYANPKRQRTLPISAPIKDFFALGTSSPFFNGLDNPEYLLLILTSGELQVLDFPGAINNYKSSVFPQSLSWIHPKTTMTRAFSVPRKQWLGMISKSVKNENLLKGGSPVQKPLRSNEIRSALLTGHTNGYVRVWDASHGELDDSSVIDINVVDALGLDYLVPISDFSFAGANAELAVSLDNGDFVLYKFDVNRRFDPKRGESLEALMGKLNLTNTGTLINLVPRAPNIKEGFLPICGFIGGTRGKITAIKNSDIGFVGIAYQNGDLIIIDRRGPAIIFNQNIIKFSSNGQSTKLTSLEFSIMSYGDDAYSSILLFGGTDKGELFTYKILQESSGRFNAQLVDVIQSNDYGINHIIPFRLDNGTPAVATLENFNQLAEGILIQGSILLNSNRDIRIINPGKNKSTHKVLNQDVLSCGLSIVPTKNTTVPYCSVIPILLSNNSMKILSNPEFKEISSLSLPFQTSSHFANYSTVLSSGDVLVRLNESEAELISIIGSGKQLHHSQTDKLFNERMKIPYRPTIGTAQWIKGTTLISYHDLDLLIGGEKRPKSKFTEESEISRGNVTLIAPLNSPKNEIEDEFAYTKPVRKRQAGGYDPSRYLIHQFQNGVDSIEESFNDYANNASQSMNETIGSAKKDLVKSLVRSKFGI